MVQLYTPENKAKISLLTPLQLRYIQDEEKRKTQVGQDFDYLNLKAVGDDDTRPKPIDFSWESTQSQAQYQLEISLMPDFFESRIIATATPSATVLNFLIGKTYYWRVKQENTCISPVHSFTVEYRAPRCIYVPSLVNIRDCGGWKTKDGKRIRQGLVYRGCEMDNHESISEEGIHVLKTELGIKTDLDLRIESVMNEIHTTPLGKGVNHVLLPCKSYGEFFEIQYAETNKEIFKLFTKKESYPIYIHCWGGADRTGTVVFLLNAMLGSLEEDLVLDWEFTSLSVWGLRSRNARRFISLMDALSHYGEDTDSWQMKAERYLLSIGVTHEDMETIKTILLEV